MRLICLFAENAFGFKLTRLDSLTMLCRALPYVTLI